MPKMKTSKTAAKRFKKTGNGQAASRAAEQPAQVRVEDVDPQASPRP